MESRLVVAKVLAKSGKAARARLQAADLQKDARAKGYGRIEREAAKLSAL